jgi:hypothetical protein
VKHLLDAAEFYAIDLGWPVLPLRVGSKEPATRRGFTEATTDREQIRRWWTERPYGIGLACEGFVVLDVDTKGGAPGRESLAALEADCGALPETWRARTASGGDHVYFAAGGANVRRSIGVRPGLDLCGRGGYVVVPPTVTEGGAYVWLEHDELAACPPWVAALSREEKPIETIAIGGRWDDVVSRSERALRYVARMPPAISGAGGHAALWRVALAVVRGFELPGPAALEVLRVYSAQCSPPWSERELHHKIQQAARASLPAGYLLDGRAA